SSCRAWIRCRRCLRSSPARRSSDLPLGKACTELVVLGEALAQAVEALGDLLARAQRKILGAGIHLDARNDAELLQQLRERRAVGGGLANGLVIHDDAADVLFHARRGEQHFAVGAAQLLGAFHADGVKTLLDGTRAFVGGEDALARSHHGKRDIVQFLEIHDSASPGKGSGGTECPGQPGAARYFSRGFPTRATVKRRTGAFAGFLGTASSYIMRGFPGGR